jgi:hypothetical protein
MNFMNIAEQIATYIGGQTEAKRTVLETLHRSILEMQPGCELWFLDGKNSEGKVVANPNIGYGRLTLHYADGSSKAFYRVGLSANSTGISVYIMGLEDKNYLATTFGPTLGKASVTGYCIKFAKLEAINLEVLLSAIQYGLDFVG